MIPKMVSIQLENQDIDYIKKELAARGFGNYNEIEFLKRIPEINYLEYS